MLIQIFYKQKNTIQSFTDSKFTKWTPILYMKSLLSSYSSNCSVSLIKTRIDLRSSEFYVSPIAAGKGLNFAACRKNMITIFEFTFKWIHKNRFSFESRKTISYYRKMFVIFFITFLTEHLWRRQRNWIEWSEN